MLLSLPHFSCIALILLHHSSILALKMCLHPKPSSVSIPLFDYSIGPIHHDIINFDYVDSITNKEDNVLRILQLNIRGIVSKQSDLRRLLLEQ